MKTLIVVALVLLTTLIVARENNNIITGAKAQKIYENLKVEATVDDPTFTDVRTVTKESEKYRCMYFVSAKTVDESYVCKIKTLS
ncbi:MAG: hypothetical protein ACLGG0_12815 [Bacteriovoracia bacterium]